MYKTYMKFLLFIFILSATQVVFSQEICNNGIDDDADGFIDLNDDECECEGFEGFSNLIPNPSFEDTICEIGASPSSYACVDYWEGTGLSGYWREIDPAYDWDILYPSPDGSNALVTFYKEIFAAEHVGTCLDVPLLAGTTYTLKLFLALGYYEGALTDINFSIYGTPICDDLPWYTGDCPIDEDSWVLLGDEIVATPLDSTWQEVTITFTPLENINALGFGPGCAGVFGHGAYHFYLMDGLTLTESDHQSDISQTGDWCDGNLELLATIDTISGTWQWFKEGIALVGETVSTVDVNLYGLGTYTAQYTLGDQCLQISEFVHFPDAVDADFIFENACFGAEIDFENTSLIPDDGEPDWIWDFGDDETSTDENPSHLYTEAGTYTVQLIGVNELSCNDTTEYQITIYPLPDANLEFIASGLSSQDGSTGGCIINPVQFNDLSFLPDPFEVVEWAWDFGDDETSTEENPEHTYDVIGTYTVTLTVTSENGCTASTEIDITMTNGMNLTLTVSDPTCFGFSDGSVTVSVEEPVGEVLFIITDDIGTILNIDNSNTANTLTTGWYYITVEDDSECAGIDSVYLNQPNEINIDLTVVDPLCNGDSTGYAVVNEVFNATGASDQISYLWNPNYVDENGLGADSLWNLNAGDYTLTINDENGCSKVFDFEVKHPDTLYFTEFGFEHAYCRLYGYQSGNGVVFASAGGGTPDYTYNWKNLDTDENIDFTTWGGLNPGNYEFTAMDANGCIIRQSLYLDSLNPIAAFNVLSDQLNTDCQGTANVDVVFENQSTNFANPNNPLADSTFFWNLNHPIANWEISKNYFQTKDTIYKPLGQSYTAEVCLVAMNKNGCTDTTCKIITVFEPIAFENINVFTPNGDGLNDIFTFDLKSASIDEFYCIITNRWGNIMIELNDISNGWDGTNQGGFNCPDGIYFYSYSAITDNGTKLQGQGTAHLLGR
ncbi:MAG: PKD domain-containing protein [Crocinitomix sp.]|nr:PKD domain-containing protein [Crocinitomix sp.]